MRLDLKLLHSSLLKSTEHDLIFWQHAFRSNENVFMHNGHTYAWNYWVFLGSTLHLTDVETKEELAVVQLLPTWRWQIISSWSWRWVHATFSFILLGSLKSRKTATSGLLQSYHLRLTSVLEDSNRSKMQESELQCVRSR